MHGEHREYREHAEAVAVARPVSERVTARRFLLPDLGEGLVEAEIIRWLVAPGDLVDVDAAVVEVETAKSVVELPSPYRGRVIGLHGEEGDTIGVGSPLVTLGPEDEPAPPSLNVAAPPSAAPVEPSTRRVPLRGARGAVAEKVTASRREIPDVTVWVDADATRLLEGRRAGRAARPGLLALLAWFALDGLRRFPALNGWVDAERREIVESSDVHLGLVVQAAHGLVVPVLPGAHDLGPGELTDEVRRVVDAARARRPVRTNGGTFSVNNYGMFGVDGSTPIINHPEVAMLGMGRVIERPWVVAGEVRPRAIAQLSLTFDHRVCDGDVAGGFLRHVADLVEGGLPPAFDVSASGW
ncbi:dihydrolipoamide acetyltransferase family protein [Sphaerisporangium sp. NPDC051017]|uniref:dihydrolipoamide acetyltransferase family protein n=1 Tax=Sphaerisporangium sp. NPDC051017 TaxID=3154636 RepID=UPI00343369C2